MTIINNYIPNIRDFWVKPKSYACSEPHHRLVVNIAKVVTPYFNEPTTRAEEVNKLSALRKHVQEIKQAETAGDLEVEKRVLAFFKWVNNRGITQLLELLRTTLPTELPQLALQLLNLELDELSRPELSARAEADLSFTARVENTKNSFVSNASRWAAYHMIIGWYLGVPYETVNNHFLLNNSRLSHLDLKAREKQFKAALFEDVRKVLSTHNSLVALFEYVTITFLYYILYLGSAYFLNKVVNWLISETDRFVSRGHLGPTNPALKREVFYRDYSWLIEGISDILTSFLTNYLSAHIHLSEVEGSKKERLEIILARDGMNGNVSIETIYREMASLIAERMPFFFFTRYLVIRIVKQYSLVKWGVALISGSLRDGMGYSAPITKLLLDVLASFDQQLALPSKGAKTHVSETVASKFRTIITLVLKWQDLVEKGGDECFQILDYLQKSNNFQTQTPDQKKKEDLLGSAGQQVAEALYNVIDSQFLENLLEQLLNVANSSLTAAPLLTRAEVEQTLAENKANELRLQAAVDKTFNRIVLFTANGQIVSQNLSEVFKGLQISRKEWLSYHLQEATQEFQRRVLDTIDKYRNHSILLTELARLIQTFEQSRLLELKEVAMELGEASHLFKDILSLYKPLAQDLAKMHAKLRLLQKSASVNGDLSTLDQEVEALAQATRKLRSPGTSLAFRTKLHMINTAVSYVVPAHWQLGRMIHRILTQITDPLILENLCRRTIVHCLQKTGRIQG